MYEYYFGEGHPYENDEEKKELITYLELWRKFKIKELSQYMKYDCCYVVEKPQWGMHYPVLGYKLKFLSETNWDEHEGK